MTFTRAARVDAEASAARPTALVTGRAGTSSSATRSSSTPRRGRTRGPYPRIIAQPGVALHDTFPQVPPLSPVELAITADG